MNPVLFAGSAHVALGEAVARAMNVELSPRAIDRFCDGELSIELGCEVRDTDVFVIQPTGPPVDTHWIELLFLGDACRRRGARRVTAVISYFGYARQSRPERGPSPVPAHVMGDLLHAAGYTSVIALDLHEPALAGLFPLPVEHLTAVPLLANAASAGLRAETVIVAPDLGAAKLAERYAHTLHRPVAVVHKMRLSGSSVALEHLWGDVAGRAPLLVDDMISTAGTVESAVRGLLAAGCLPAVTVIATHGVFAGPAVERLRKLPLVGLVVTDSLPEQTSVTEAGLPLRTISVAPLIADAIKSMLAPARGPGL